MIGLGLSPENFAAAGTPAWSLSQDFAEPNAAVWFDFGDASTLFTETTGAAASTPAVVDGPVGTVLDKSGNGAHLIAPNGTARPTLRVIGGRYALQFDGVANEMGLELPGSEWSSIHAMAVAQMHNDDSDLFHFYASTADSGHGLRLRSGTGGSSHHVRVRTGWSSQGSTLVLPSFGLGGSAKTRLGVAFENDEVQLYANGSEAGQVTGSVVGSPFTNVIVGNDSTGGDNLNAEVFQLVILRSSPDWKALDQQLAALTS